MPILLHCCLHCCFVLCVYNNTLAQSIEPVIFITGWSVFSIYGYPFWGKTLLYTRLNFFPYSLGSFVYDLRCKLMLILSGADQRMQVGRKGSFKLKHTLMWIETVYLHFWTGCKIKYFKLLRACSGLSQRI